MTSASRARGIAHVAGSGQFVSEGREAAALELASEGREAAARGFVNVPLRNEKGPKWFPTSGLKVAPSSARTTRVGRFM